MSFRMSFSGSSLTSQVQKKQGVKRKLTELSSVEDQDEKCIKRLKNRASRRKNKFSGPS